ncbi:MAG: DUF444 family protein [Planctomycetota bacterium]
MVQKIDRDHTRFREIVRGRIKRDLKKFVSSGELIGKRGDRYVSIPIPQIQLPRFRFGPNPRGGVGQGDGEDGTPIDGQGDGAGTAGEEPGQHILEVEVEFSELAQILGEELELPRIEPKGKKMLNTRGGAWRGIRRAGPESLRHFKRTYREALRRQIMAGIYDPEDPIILPVSADKRYRSRKDITTPQANAVIVYMMDVSGSMGREQKEMVRIEAFWIDAWLRSQYKNIEVQYIVHDAVAHVVDHHTFFHLRESGGTKISSAYELCLRMMKERYPLDEWNIYPFHFSDGDNWSARDTEHCIQLLREQMLPGCNQFCYGQVKSAYGSGQFKKDLDASFGEDDQIVTSDILDRDGILPSIKDFLGKGR